jgi:hypothetical protein
VCSECDLDPAERVEPIEDELGEPLLIDPLATLRPDGERVVGRETVLDDLASPENGEPAVLKELAWKVSGDPDEEERDNREEHGLGSGPAKNAIENSAPGGLGRMRLDLTHSVHDWLDVFDHPEFIQDQWLLPATGRKVGPART